MKVTIDLETMIQVGTDAYHSTIIGLIEKVRSFLDIASMAVHKIYEDGRFYQIANVPDMQRYMCQPANITRIPFYCHPDHQLNGAFCSSAVINDDWENNLDLLQQNFIEQDRRFLIINRKNYIDNSVLTFACSLNTHPSPENLFVTHLNLINLFFTHFVNELAPAFSALEKHSVNLHQVIGTERFMLAPFGEVQKKMRKEIDVLEDVGLLPVGSRLIYQLSKQELRCFLALLEHESSREIGVSLSLSSRTVEHYLENIKNKMTIDSRKELRNLAFALRSLSYI